MNCSPQTLEKQFKHRRSPFPALEESPLKQRIRDLGERLDAHRKRQQEQHPDLTLTGICNVLQKIRSGEALNAKDKIIHVQGLVSVLKQLHDDLDQAVLEAYGWEESSRSVGVSPTSGEKECGRDAHTPCSDILARGGTDAESLEQSILTRLVALNHERAGEEKRGIIRYLRPDFQRGGDHRSPSPPEASIQEDLAGTDPDSSIQKSKINNHQSSINPSFSLAWPESLPEQVAVLRKLIAGYDNSVVTPDPETLAACFGRKNKKRTDQISAILATLKALGHLA